MNHQPFRDWLLSDDKLSPDQSQVLREHLITCESCSQIVSAWTEVQDTFSKVPRVRPAPGFTARWQVHLAEYHHRKQERHGWIMIGFTGLLVMVLLVLITIQVYSLLQSPEPYIMAWFLHLVNLASLYLTFQDFYLSMPGFLPIYTLVGVFFLVGMISFMSVLWLATYRKLIMPRRLL